MQEQEFISRVKGFIAEALPLKVGSENRVLVALSGGADSVALLRVLLTLGYDVVAAHCNFHLRAQESDRDERFVTELCKRLSVQLLVTHFDVPKYERTHHVSCEMACRELRYEWFERMRLAQGCAYIAVAHHYNDSEETFMLNALRGTGLRGLAGIGAVNGVIIRPLLCVDRTQIEQYLSAIQQDYVTDSTNLQSDFKRNKLRNIVLPQIKSLFPEQNLSRTLDNVRRCMGLYDDMLRAVKLCCIKQTGDIVTVDLSYIKENFPTSATTLLFELVTEYGFNGEQCSDMLTAQTGAQFFSSTGYVATRSAMGLQIIAQAKMAQTDSVYHFALHRSPNGADLLIESLDPTQDCSEISHILRADILPANEQFAFERNARVCYCSVDLLGRELTLRHYRQGDFIQPFSLGGRRKKVSDLFSDSKLSLPQKRSVWILECEGKILWVAGLRTSIHFPCHRGEDVLRLRVLP